MLKPEEEISSFISQILNLNVNFFLVALTPRIHRHYRCPIPLSPSTHGPLAYPKLEPQELISLDWLADIGRRISFCQHIVCTLSRWDVLQV